MTLPTLTVLLISFGTALITVTQEFLFKHYGVYSWYSVVCALGISVGIWQLAVRSPNLPTAFLIFSLCNLALRTAVSLYMEWHIGTGTWVAIALFALGLVARQTLGK